MKEHDPAHLMPKLKSGKNEREDSPDSQSQAWSPVPNKLQKPNSTMDQSSSEATIRKVRVSVRAPSEVPMVSPSSYSFCMHEYVASCLRDNIIMVPCPDPKCKVKYGPEYFCSLLPFEVFKRWQKVIKDCNTPILDKQLDKNPIHVADDEENNDVKEDATIVIESDDDDSCNPKLYLLLPQRHSSLKLSSSLISLGVAHSSRTQLSPSLVSGLPHCLRTGTQARRCSLGSGLSHGLWSPTQSRSLAFPAIVITDGRSSRSRDWSSSSLPVSHRLAVSPAPSLRSSLPAEEAAGPGASPRCQQLSPSASFAQPEASPDLELAAVQLSFRFMTLEMDLAILVIIP
nr:uncharacterized protein LOC114924886 [Arachis hypogaea]